MTTRGYATVMTLAAAFSLGLFFVVIAAQVPAPTSAAPVLSEVEQLRIQVTQLRTQVHQQQRLILQLQMALTEVDGQALAKAKADVEASLLATHPTMRVDWSTGQLIPAETAPKK